MAYPGSKPSYVRCRQRRADVVHPLPVQVGRYPVLPCGESGETVAVRSLEAAQVDKHVGHRVDFARYAR